MGMFDYIDYECRCPNCECMLNDFQSKDGPCGLEILEPYMVDSFYTRCKGCGFWVVGRVERDCVVVDIQISAEEW